MMLKRYSGGATKLVALSQTNLEIRRKRGDYWMNSRCLILDVDFIRQFTIWPFVADDREDHPYKLLRLGPSRRSRDG